MINAKLVLCILLSSGSVLGMKREIASLKADLILEKYFDGKSGPDVLCRVMCTQEISLNKELIEELIRRGSDVNYQSERGGNVLGHAIRRDSIRICNILRSFGASVEKGFKDVLKDHHYRSNSAGIYCGSKWFDSKRQPILMAYLLSMQRLNVFPKEIQLRIFSYCLEMIPSYCLDRFYSRGDVAQIVAERDAKVERLFAKFRDWPTEI